MSSIRLFVLLSRHRVITPNQMSTTLVSINYHLLSDRCTQLTVQFTRSNFLGIGRMKLPKYKFILTFPKIICMTDIYMQSVCVQTHVHVCEYLTDVRVRVKYTQITIDNISQILMTDNFVQKSTRIEVVEPKKVCIFNN